MPARSIAKTKPKENSVPWSVWILRIETAWRAGPGPGSPDSSRCSTTDRAAALGAGCSHPGRCTGRPSCRPPARPSRRSGPTRRAGLLEELELSWRAPTSRSVRPRQPQVITDPGDRLRRHLDLMHPHEPEARAAGAPPKLPPGMGDQLHHFGGDAAAAPRGVTRDEPRRARFPRPVSPLPNGLAVQAEPRRRRLDAMDRRIVEDSQASLHLPPVCTADRPIDHGGASFLGLRLIPALQG